MLKKTLLATLLLALIAPLALADDMWLHVRVDEAGENGELVRVNLPLSMIEAALPLIEDEHFKNGKIIIDNEVGIGEFSQEDLRNLWEAIRDMPDGEYVTVKSRSENVRVAKERGFLLADVTDGEGDSQERVKVRIPLVIFEALIESSLEEFDLMAALEALGRYDGDLVRVEEAGGSIVRVWIDDQQVSD